MKQLRIGLVIPGISQSSTGPSVSVQQLAEKLSAVGHRVVVVASDLTTGGGVPDPIVDFDPRVELRLFRTSSSLERRLYMSRSLKEWFKINVHKFDVVDIQGVWSFAAVNAAKLCNLAGVPYVMTPRGQMALWDWRRSRKRKLIFYWTHLRRALNGASAIRFLSEREEDSSAVPIAARAVVIPNWVNLTSSRDESETRALKRKISYSGDGASYLVLG